MLRLLLLAFFCPLLLPTTVAAAGVSPLAPKVGDTYEITKIQKDTGSSGSSYDKYTITEQVIGHRPDGLELEYDLPKEADAEERARTWQLPARVFKPLNGPPQLLNGPELEARVDSWLKAGGLSRAACGHTIFTWDAFRIECDPQAVIKMVEAFDLITIDLHDGASYQDPLAIDPGKLEKKVVGPDEVTFSAEMHVNPDTVHHARAESDVAGGEIIHKPVTLEAALGQREKETVSGTISVVFEADSAGNIHRRTTVTKVDIKGSDSKSETGTTTETVEQRLISAPTAADADREKRPQ